MTDVPRNKSNFEKSLQSNGVESVKKAKRKDCGTTTVSSPLPKQKKTLKRPSPFRIKTGCVVALRVNPEGNQISKVDSKGQITAILPDASLIPVWTNPVKDRDEGLALVGKRVRCFIPKKFVEGKKSRVLEGEVLAIHEYMKRPEDKPWKVDLLVEKSMLAEFPFLVRTDEDVDLSQLPTDKAKRNVRLEQALRGINKCSVRVRLAQPGSVDGKNALKWAIQKTVPRRLLQSIQSSNGAKGKTGTGKRNTEESDAMDNSDRGVDGGSTENQKEETPRKKRKVEQNATKYVGDRDDTADQQIANWRWMVSRYHDMLMNSEDMRSKATESQILSTGFVGEVIKVESMPKGSSSLATVTVQRLILPEHTVYCTSPDSGRADLYDDSDNLQNLFRIPAEELVVLSRKIQRNQEFTEEDDDGTGVNVPIFICKRRYSVMRNVYVQERFDTETPGEEFPPCHRCRRPVHDAEASVECCAGTCSLVDPPGDRTFFCMDCLRFLRDSCPDALPDDSESPPCYMEFCDCLACRVRYSNDVSSSINTSSAGRRLKDNSPSRIFQSAIDNAENIDWVEFGLPDTMLDSWSSMAAPSSKPVSRAKNVGQKTPVKSANGRKKNDNLSEKGDKEVRDAGVSGEATKQEDPAGFKASCARHLPYEAIKSRTKTSYDAASVGEQDRPRNLREFMSAIAFGAEVDSRTNQRAERAKQRRLIKGISAFSNLDLDTLASRESQLRFGRSAIHAWGVFADKDISSGDMIVEYRGEIIENTMAEKREKLYEAAKIGSDYMFRIDANFVCDATKVGNVARFINASCDPNCYTKIINVDGQKRIVIYAKKDIPAGEELCYDYKFSLEYDPDKRIPCRCGASNCRGFMNWDKKYVLVGAPEGQTTNGVKLAKNAGDASADDPSALAKPGEAKDAE
mmetsp:Transcript_4917/g.10093  ORF Transcript_4917/g.10093 Transcript_4917/m.10093 type:complete len:911 (-) Transcript_4917:70-2802(-)